MAAAILIPATLAVLIIAGAIGDLICRFFMW